AEFLQEHRPADERMNFEAAAEGRPSTTDPGIAHAVRLPSSRPSGVAHRSGRLAGGRAAATVLVHAGRAVNPPDRLSLSAFVRHNRGTPATRERWAHGNRPRGLG